MNTPPKFDIWQWLKSKTGWSFLAFLAIAAFFLITEHRAHLFGVLPSALLLLAIILSLIVFRELDDRKDQ